ncbi:MAG: biotin transporter BioY [Acidobacteriota bacterium]|nr:biotin transporter BioY [Acidobacteriota bacterium]
MQEIIAIDKLHRARYLFFRWRHGLALVNKIALAVGMACLTGLVAQLKISLPWTPVPISGQTLAVLLAGVLLGRWWGGISQVIYVIIGVAGLPWLAGFSGGVGALLGPTGGYLIGFILAALFLGHFTDKYIRARNFLPMLGLMLFADFILIHIPGLLQLGLWSYLAKGTGLTLRNLLWMGTVPFIIGDLFKIITAAALAGAITPREAYNGEVDAKRADE